jgi:hypothetical protein
MERVAHCCLVAVSTEGAIAFRMIHEPSGKLIRYVKGIETECGFKEVPPRGGCYAIGPDHRNLYGHWSGHGGEPCRAWLARICHNARLGKKASA